MKIDGIYDVKVQTPVGEQSGTLTFEYREGILNGSLENPKGISNFTANLDKDQNVSFSTRIQTPLGRLKAEVSGKIVDGEFSGTARLPLGKAQISGHRREE